jgi:hypothetical protein
MDEQQAPAPATTTEGAVLPASQPETLAELAQTPLPAPAARPGVKSGPSTKKPTPQRLMEQASVQVDALRQAETIRQLQKQVSLLEGQSRDAGKVFLATLTTLLTSAFGFVAALAWNDAIQALLKAVFPNTVDAFGLVVTAFVYAVFVTLIVVIAIYYLTRLNKRFGGKSLIGESKGAGHEG